jgi:hypothetical protein
MMSDPQVSVPLFCPVCGERAIDRILEDLSITAKGPAEEKQVGGLAAFMCTANGHVFFVRYLDLSLAAPA